MRLSRLLASAALLALPSALSAQSWTNWTSRSAPGSPLDTVRGTLTFGSQTVGVRWTGTSYFTQLNNSGTNFWTPLAAFSTGTVTGPTTSDIIALGVPSRNFLLFDAPVTDLFMAVNSLGQGGLPVTYQFDKSFTIVKDNSGAPCPYWGCGALTGSGTSTLQGYEGSGIIQFSGSITSLSWDSNAEFWHGFTVGANDITSTVPEPSTWALFGTGLVAVGFLRRRR